MKTSHLIDLVFDNLHLRKAYHFICGSLATWMLIHVANSHLLLALGLLYVIAFWVWGKRISFAVLGVLLLAIVTGSRFVCAGAFPVLTTGDCASAVVGFRYGRTAWPWQRAKTVLGTVAFFLISFVAMVVFIRYTGLSSNAELMWLAFLPAATGAAVECLPTVKFRDLKLDDNLWIVVSSGLVLTILSDAFATPNSM